MLRTKRLFLACAVIVLLLSPGLAAGSPATESPAAGVVAQPVAAAAWATAFPSRALRAMPTVPTTAPSETSASVSSPPAVSGVSPEVAAGWAGLQGVVAGPAPPDPILSTGPTQVVEMVNLQMAVYSKQGSPLQVTDLSTLFHTGTDFISDPKVQYDPASGRWFATLTDVTTTQVPLVVSDSADATGTWHLYEVPSASTGHCLDQPILGVGTKTVVVSVNVFTQTSPSNCVIPYLGAEYWVINKTDLVAGAVARLYDSGINSLEGSIHPVQIEGTSSVMYMVATYWPGTAISSSTLHLFAVSGVPPATPTITLTSISMPTAAIPPSASQLGTRSTLDTADIRVSDAVWSSGRIWLGFDEACLADSSRACFRLVQLDAGSAAVLQDFDVNVAGRDVFYPAMRVDGSGDLAVVFGYSSSLDYPGMMTTGRVFGDPANTYQAPEILEAGTGPETSACAKGVCRYGDYFGAALDPANASVVWLVGQVGTGAAWATYVFSVSVKAQLTLSYALMGGGTGYGNATVSYVHGGVATQGTFGPSPTTLLADPATAWSVSPSLSGSSTAAGEVWVVNASSGAPATSGLASASLTVSLTYFHQYRATLSFSVLGGSGYTASPSVNATMFGAAVALALPGTYYLDAGTSYAYPSLLAGSASSERWIASSAADGNVSGVLDLTVAYYHQVRVTFDYTIVGTAATAPHVNYSALGSAAAVFANATVWADSQTAYAYEATLANPALGVRWGPESGGNGTVTVPQRFSVLYREQFHLGVSVQPAGLAADVTTSGWYDAGFSVALTASAPSGWQFAGWSGDAAGSSASTSVRMDAPKNVTATFDAGLTLVAGAGGSVAYTYGSVSGTVAAGTSVTIYVPAGTSVTVAAHPSSWMQTFAGWSGAAGGASPTTTVTVAGPATASANFGLNALAVAGVSLVVVLVIAGLVVVLVLRRRRQRPPAP